MAPQNPQYGNGSAFPSSNDALIFTTMCVVGMPVKVQVKDGSIYAGIFHTACIENDYGVVLKMARVVRRGMTNDNFVGESFVATLVILSSDLVQVVAKDVILPSDGHHIDIYSEDNAAISWYTGTLQEQTFECERERKLQNEKLVEDDPGRFKDVDTRNDQNTPSVRSGEGCEEANKVKRSLIEKAIESSAESISVFAKSLCSTEEAIHKTISSPCFVKLSSAPAVVDDERQDVQYESQGQEVAIDNDTRHSEETLVRKSQHSIPRDVGFRTSSPNPPLPKIEIIEQSTITNATAPDTIFLNLSIPSSLPVEFPSSSYANSVPPATCSLASKTSLCNHKSKLNPGAKTFSPSPTNIKAATPIISSVGQILDISSLPVMDVQPGAGFNSPMPHAALPVKYAQHSNVAVGNTGIYPQTSQPMFGHMVSRPQPIRYIGQYVPPQAGAAYVHPSNQTVMVSRLGQVVYMPSFSQDSVHGVSSFPQGLVRPMLNIHQSVLPKHHGTAAQPVQLCVAPPFTPGIHQPLLMPNHFPISQPFPAIHSVPVVSGTGIHGSKFTV